MLLINQNSTDPYFNIAAEEYLLRYKSEEVFILYINAPSLIVGKHQNTLSEINYRYIIENDIPVIRRISGGGTVYHDLGNLNFTIITNGQPGQLIDFKQSTMAVKKALEHFGIEAKNEGKNNLCVNGLKISGNAAHVYKNRVMHHGTLLVSSDMIRLKAALNISINKYHDRGVKSIRADVLNLERVNNLSIESLRHTIIDKISTEPGVESYSLQNNETFAIKQLITEKYNTWEWNYGYSPLYEFINKVYNPELYLRVEKGIIKEAKTELINGLSKELIGLKHAYFEILNILHATHGLAGKNIRELAWSFF